MRIGRRAGWRWGRLVRLSVLITTLAGPVATTVSAADFQAGLAAADRGDYATALREWLPLAESGSPTAQYNVALLYKNGWGVERDHFEALAWLWQAAEQGLADAQFAIGKMYEEGQGMPRNDIQAYAWFHVAAAEGHGTAVAARDAAGARLAQAELEAARALGQRLVAMFTQR